MIDPGRFWRQLGLLPILWVVNEVSPTLFTIIVAVSLIVGATVATVVAIQFNIAARQDIAFHEAHAEEAEEHSRSLEINAANLTTGALIAWGLAMAAAVRLANLAGYAVEGRPILVLLSWALVLIAVPAWTWARANRSVRFWR